MAPQLIEREQLVAEVVLGHEERVEQRRIARRDQLGITTQCVHVEVDVTGPGASPLGLGADHHALPSLVADDQLPERLDPHRHQVEIVLHSDPDAVHR